MSIQVTITKSSVVTNQASFPSMEEAQQWLDRHVGMGTFLAEEATVEDVSAVEAQRLLNEQSLEYLSSTDWLIIREYEGGLACPQQIKDLRAAARLRIVR
jgi:hypothetical protein